MRKHFLSFASLLVACAIPAPAAQNFSPLYSYSLFAGTVSGATIDGSLSDARFSGPVAVATDAAGNLYVAERLTVRKIGAGGGVTTLAGQPGFYGSADGAGSQAQFSQVQAIAVDIAGNVYVADAGSHTIRKITPAGVVSTLAGNPGSKGAVDGQGAAARFNSPSGVAVDGGGNLYVADAGNHTVRKITSAGAVSTLAGSAGTSGSTDGNGAAARFNLPRGLAVDTAGAIWVCDTGNATIRKVSATGDVTTFAATAGVRGATDGTGSAARFSSPEGIAVDSAGNLFVSDGSARTIRKITPAAAVSTLAGTPDAYGWTDATGAAASFTRPGGVALDALGNLYVPDRDINTIRKITPGGAVSTHAGLLEENTKGYVEGAGTSARFNTPYGIAVDGSGNVYVGDGNRVIRKITPAGTVSTFVSWPGNTPLAMVFDAAGNLFAVDQSTLSKVTPAGGISTVASAPYGRGVALDAAGNAYIGTWQRNVVLKVTPQGVVSTFAGMEGSSGNQDGAGTGAQFYLTAGVATDSAGNVYVADAGNRTIRRITPAGVVSTYAGQALGSGRDDGAVASATFSGLPHGLKADPTGNLYVSNLDDFSIRRITAAGMVSTIAGLDFTPGSTANTTGLFNSGFKAWDVAVNASGVIYFAVGNSIWKGVPVSAPAITTHPQSQTVSAGGTVQFSVSATGSPAPAYQWYFNGSPYQGATGTTLSFSNARSSDAGDYTVVVTNSAGSVTSNKATLSVNASSGSGSSGSSGSGGSSGGGGGGGGAPSLWFVAVLAALTGLRRGRSAPELR